MTLTDEHIDFIIKDLTARGIIIEGVQSELIDHICSAVEDQMENGQRFTEAYHHILKDFGSTSGLRETQLQTWKAENYKPNIMIRNYLVIGLRNLRKQGFYSAINIFGLAVGVAVCIIIALYVTDELSYDKYNTKAHRIYRVDADVKFGGNHFTMAFRSAPEAQTLVQNYPEVESAVRFRLMSPYFVKTGERSENFKEHHVVWTDSTFFKIFSVKVLEGNPNLALSQPASIAISRRIADKYFPGKSAMGQSMILDNKYHATVTAVYENIPSTSSFHFDILISMVGDWPVAREASGTSYMSENFVTFLLLKEGADPAKLQSQFPKYIETYLGPEMTKALGDDFSIHKFRAAGNRYDVSLRPLLDIHLHSNVKGEFEPTGNITYVYLFTVIGIIILGIACINFMNLSTARSGNRAKEVGVRKVMGSLRVHLIRQFLTESFLITTTSILLAVFIAYVTLPFFSDVSQKELTLPLDSSVFYGALFCACILLGLMAGFYPAFLLSAFKPVNVLKGQTTSGPRGSLTRSALVVFQFVISIFLIIGATTVNMQLTYIHNKNLGFEKDQVLIIHDTYALRPNNVQAFRNEAVRLEGVESGTVSGYVPVESDWAWRNNNTFWKEGETPSIDNLVAFQRWGVDHDYLKTFGMKVKLGRNFSSDFPSDSSAVILNETAVARLGLKDPLGKKIIKFDDGNDVKVDPQKWTIIGVIEDFHFSTMKEGILPLGLFLDKSDGSVSFKFKASHTQDVVQSIERIWKQLAPGSPYQYSFLDKDFEVMYLAEQRLAQIFVAFAVLAVVIACLGLFALTAFAAQQRTKEIGIRKVLGASANSIFMLLSRDFGKLILIAFIISAPGAWFAVDWWLSGFKYKTQIGLHIYVLAGALAFIIALMTMSYQALKAAFTNPATSLRNE